MPTVALPITDDLVRRILVVDAHVLVLDKPAGLAVHPGPATPHSLEAHLIGLRAGLRPLAAAGAPARPRHQRGASSSPATPRRSSG